MDFDATPGQDGGSLIGVKTFGRRAKEPGAPDTAIRADRVDSGLASRELSAAEPELVAYPQPAVIRVPGQGEQGPNEDGESMLREWQANTELAVDMSGAPVSKQVVRNRQVKSQGRQRQHLPVKVQRL